MIAIISLFFSLLYGVPSAVFSALSLSNPLIYLVSNALNLLSFSNAFFSATSLDVGNAGLATDIFFEILGVFGLVLSIFSTFPDLIDEVVKAGYYWGVGDAMQRWLDTYGCPGAF